MASRPSISTNELRASGAAWLRYKRQYPLISFERSPSWHSRPDIYAVTDDRYVVEIEIKTSFPDFKADAKKIKWEKQKKKPRQFYYLVPPELVQKVELLLKPEHGLMTVSELLNWEVREIVVVKKAPLTKNPWRLENTEYQEMVRHQSGTIAGLSKEIAHWAKSNKEGDRLRVLHYDLLNAFMCEEEGEGHDPIQEGEYCGSCLRELENRVMTWRQENKS